MRGTLKQMMSKHCQHPAVLLLGTCGHLHSHLPDSPEPRISFDMLPTLRRSSIFCGDFPRQDTQIQSPKTQETSNPKNLNPGNLKSIFHCEKSRSIAVVFFVLVRNAQTLGVGFAGRRGHVSTKGGSPLRSPSQLGWLVIGL